MTWRPGAHQLIAGPTQSGKSLLAQRLADLRRYVVVFGTKVKDRTLEEYLARGYVRIDHWPPRRSDFKDMQEGTARFVLWPKIKKREDLRKFRPLFAKFLDEVFIEGRWTVVVDETLWMSARTGLALGNNLADMAYGSASNDATFVFLMQRPAGVPRLIWQSCSDAMLFHMGVTSDLREMASLGTNDPRAVQAAIAGLEGNNFLALPCRGGGARWSVTMVDKAAPAPALAPLEAAS